MTIELEKNVPKDAARQCGDYNREPQTLQEKCTSDENCEYTVHVDSECRRRLTKKVNQTYKVPDPSIPAINKEREIYKTLETRNLEYSVNDDNTEVKLKAENIHCLDWGNIMKVFSRNNDFIVNETSNSIKFAGEKCQEFVETISPKTLDGDVMNNYEWVNFPSVGEPIIENDTLRFEVNEPQFQGCEHKSLLLLITCNDVNGTAHEIGPVNGTGINMEIFQDKHYELCFAIAYMYDSPFKIKTRIRKKSPFFQPSGQIYVDDVSKLAIIIPSSVAGAIVGLAIMGKMIFYFLFKIRLFNFKLLCLCKSCTKGEFHK